SRTAARAAARGRSSPSSQSPSSMRPPGNTQAPPWNASFDDRLSSSVSRPCSPSRSTTSVAAGLASAPLGAPSDARARSAQFFNGQVTLLVPGPQHLLVELAHARLRDLVDERPVL